MSIWGEPFEDELHDDLRHNARGVLSMANSGPNSNKAFFHTFLADLTLEEDFELRCFGIHIL